MKVYAIFFFTTAIALLIVTAIFNPVSAQVSKEIIKTVVIDAGHGGIDAGAVRHSMLEKDINLSVALRLGDLINKNYPTVKVIYTRKTDVFVKLHERGAIANRANADLFISIHTNAAKNSAAIGTETLIMGADAAGKNLDVAMKENDVILYEEDYQVKYQGYVPGSTESFIIFSLMQYSFQSQSMILADMVQRQFSKNSTMRNRGVKPAGVLVLWSVAMPSILTEFGFISNPTEAAFIHSAKGREVYARSVFNAFSEYKTQVEGNGKRIELENSEISDITPSANNITTDTHTATSTQTQTAPTPKSATASVAVYRIQLASSSKKIPKNSAVFGPYRGQISEKIINNLYKYYIGELTNYEEALSLLRETRNSIKGAFIVPFVKENPISLDEARKMK